MNRLKYIVGLWLLLLSHYPSFGQPYSEYGFARIDNLPSGKVYGLLIDKKGYLWVGHNLGVSRYDGKKFTSYYNNRQSSLSIGNLVQDAQGRIWCQNFSGQVFYIEHNKMNLLPLPDANLSLSDFVINDHELVATSERGLFIYDLERSKGYVKEYAQDIPLNTVKSMYSHEGIVYLLTDFGNQNKLLQYRQGHFRVIDSTFKKRYIDIVSISNHVLILKERGGDQLDCFDLNKGGLVWNKTLLLPGSSFYTTSSSTKDGLWLHGQMQSLNLNTGRHIDHLALTDYLIDREGNTWASSSFYGLLFKREASQWQLFSKPQHKNITSLSLWGNKLIAGTSTGKVLVADSSSFFNTSFITPEYLVQNAIAGLFPVKNGWCVYGTSYILLLNNRFQVVKQFDFYGSDFTALPNHYYVFSSDKGLFALLINGNIPTNERVDTRNIPDIIQKNFYTLASGKEFLEKTHKGRVRGIAYDSLYHILYAGFYNGLFQYTKEGRAEIKLLGHPIYSTAIKHWKNRVYISTLNNGLLVIQDGKAPYRLHPGNTPIPDRLLNLIISNKHLWILGVDRILLYDLEKQTFLDSIVLPPVTGSEVSDIIELNGSAYFATNKGIYQTSLREKRERVLPLNYLLSAVANNVDTLKKGSSIPYNRNSIQFNLSSLYYENPQGVYYKYRMVGMSGDTGWKNSAPNQDEILFPYIIPGKYKFEAVAFTEQGLSAQHKIVFPFTINKPWWKQAWFIISLILTIGTLAYLFISWRIRVKKEAHLLALDSLKQQSERLMYENMFIESELKALKSQMNPHFISNSLNAIQELFMYGDKEAANEQLANFAMLTRQILALSGSQSITLRKEIELLRRYLSLEKIRFQDDFNYEIIIDENIYDTLIKIPPMIIQPFVENSVIHGLLHKKGNKKLTIKISLQQERQYLICRITDNGIGREEAEKLKRRTRPGRSSFSIDAIKKRLDLMEKTTGRKFILEYTDIKDSNGIASGTTVKVSIPVFTA